MSGCHTGHEWHRRVAGYITERLRVLAPSVFLPSTLVSHLEHSLLRTLLRGGNPAAALPGWHRWFGPPCHLAESTATSVFESPDGRR
jgi:hypothetical protein